MHLQIVDDPEMEDLRKTKEKLSLRYLSQTPEENQRDTEEALKRAQAALSKPLVFADHSTPRTRVEKEKQAQF